MARSRPPAGSLSVRQVAPVIMMVFANNFGQSLIFPFLPFMVKDFLHVPRNEVGFYSGFLASAFHVGSFIGSLMWGAVADRFGRRPTLLSSLALTMIWMLLFGFSRSFSWAVIARFLWGLSTGVVGVSKTVLSESSTSATTARTFSFIGFSSGLGRLFGPAIGGLLVGLIPDFPYILPLLICLLITAISFVLGLIFLKETLVKRLRKVHKPLPGQQSQDSSISHEYVELLQKSENSPTANRDMLQNRKTNTSTTSPPDHEHKSEPNSWSCCLCTTAAPPYDLADELAQGRLSCYSCRKNIVNVLRNYVQLLKDRVIRTVCIVYTMLAFTALMHYELIPLLLVVNFAHGGLCLNSAEIGIVLAFVGIIQLLIQLFIYPQLSKRFSYRRIFQAGMIGLAMSVMLLPWLPNFTGNQDPIRAEETTRNSTVFDSTPLDWSMNSNWSRPFSQSPTTLPYGSDVSSSDQNSSRATKLTLVSVNASVADNICLVSKGVIGNNTDECGRPLETSSKSSTMNYKLIKCLAWSVWLIVFIIVGGGFWLRTVSFTSVNILINNSCEMNVRARVNGLSMSMSAVGRLLAPLIISNLFAVTDTNSPHSAFTVEHHIPAWVTAIFAIICALWCLKLPLSIEKKKVATSAEPKNTARPSQEDEKVTLADDDGDEDNGPSGDQVQLVKHLRTTIHEQESPV